RLWHRAMFLRRSVGVYGGGRAEVEHFRVLHAQAQRAPDGIELRAPVREVREHVVQERRAAPRVGRGLLDLLEQRHATRVIDRAPIVRIDDAEVPDLIALIDIRDAGARELEQRLPEAIQEPRQRDRADELVEIVEERIALTLQGLPP